MTPEEYIVTFLIKYGNHPASLINYSEITNFAKYVKNRIFEEEQKENEKERHIIREIKLPINFYNKLESFLNVLNKTTKLFILDFIVLQINSPNQDLHLGDEFQNWIRTFREKSSKKQKHINERQDFSTQKDELPLNNQYFQILFFKNCSYKTIYR